MTDYYLTDNAKRQDFTARPVVGGVFLQMLYNKTLWHKYADRDKTRAKNWATIPPSPRYVTVVPTSLREPAQWRYTVRKPSKDWCRSDFNDSNWKKGLAGFGTIDTPGAKVRTRWNTPDIWIRRTFELPDTIPDRIILRMHHDEEATVYLNGILAANASGYSVYYNTTEVLPAAQKALHPGKNVIAIHYNQTKSGQYIDAGLDSVKKPPKTE